MKKLLVALLCLLASPALAQTAYNRTQLYGNAASSFPDNTGGYITPAILRQYELNNAASLGVLSDSNVWSGPNTFQFNPTFSACSGAMFGNGASGTVGCATGTLDLVANFGAACDGVTDDTAKIQAWASAMTAFSRLTYSGTCVFKSQIVFPQVYGATIDGGGHSTLLYAGASTTLDPLIQIGAEAATAGCAVKGWSLLGIRLMSSTIMTAGDGLRISDACQMIVDNITIGGNLDNGNQNLFNAYHLDGGNSVYTQNYVFSGSNDGIRINGESNLSHAFTDPFFDQGQVSHSLVGIHICGGVGGFSADLSDILQNGTNVLTDQTCAATPNLQLTFGPQFYSDATTGGSGIGVHISDHGGPNTIISYLGWLATATNQCFVYDAGAPTSGVPIVSFQGARIGNCHSPAGAHGAIENQNATAQFNFMGTRFFTSQGGGVPTFYNAGPNAIIQGITVDTNFSISPTTAWIGLYMDGTRNLTASPFGSSLSATVLTSTNPGASFQWRPTGGTQPADTKNWDMFESSTTGNLDLRALNDAFNASTSFLTVARGTGYTGTGAKVTSNVPLVTNGLSAGGAAPTATGTCPINTQTVGNQAGSFKLNGACVAGTVIFTFATSSPTGWHCHADNMTTPTNLLSETAYTANTVTLAGSGSSGDQIAFSCIGF